MDTSAEQKTRAGRARLLRKQFKANKSDNFERVEPERTRLAFRAAGNKFTQWDARGRQALRELQEAARNRIGTVVESDRTRPLTLYWCPLQYSDWDAGRVDAGLAAAAKGAKTDDLKAVESRQFSLKTERRRAEEIIAEAKAIPSKDGERDEKDFVRILAEEDENEDDDEDEYDKLRYSYTNSSNPRTFFRLLFRRNMFEREHFFSADPKQREFGLWSDFYDEPLSDVGFCPSGLFHLGRNIEKNIHGLLYHGELGRNIENEMNWLTHQELSEEGERKQRITNNFEDALRAYLDRLQMLCSVNPRIDNRVSKGLIPDSKAELKPFGVDRTTEALQPITIEFKNNMRMFTPDGWFCELPSLDSRCNASRAAFFLVARYMRLKWDDAMMKFYLLSRFRLAENKYTWPPGPVQGRPTPVSDFYERVIGQAAPMGEPVGPHILTGDITGRDFVSWLLYWFHHLFAATTSRKWIGRALFYRNYEDPDVDNEAMLEQIRDPLDPYELSKELLVCVFETPEDITNRLLAQDVFEYQEELTWTATSKPITEMRQLIELANQGVIKYASDCLLAIHPGIRMQNLTAAFGRVAVRAALKELIKLRNSIRIRQQEEAEYKEKEEDRASKKRKAGGPEQQQRNVARKTDELPDEHELGNEYSRILDPAGSTNLALKTTDVVVNRIASFLGQFQFFENS